MVVGRTRRVNNDKTKMFNEFFFKHAPLKCKLKGQHAAHLLSLCPLDASQTRAVAQQWDASSHFFRGVDVTEKSKRIFISKQVIIS